MKIPKLLIAIIVSAVVIFLISLANFSNFTGNDLTLNYQIIYLNGPSSAGKSVIAGNLQEKLEEPFLHIGIDKVIEMMPKKFNDWEGGEAPEGFSWKVGKDEEGVTIYELQKGPFAEKISETYRQIVLTLVEQGHYIIIDDVAFGKADVDKWKDLLSDYKVLYVGIKLPLEVVEHREKSRGDRMIGSARAQHQQVHVGVKYDLEVDNHHNTPEENVDKIISELKM